MRTMIGGAMTAAAPVVEDAVARLRAERAERHVVVRMRARRPDARQRREGLRCSTLVKELHEAVDEYRVDAATLLLRDEERDDVREERFVDRFATETRHR